MHTYHILRHLDFNNVQYQITIIILIKEYRQYIQVIDDKLSITGQIKARGADAAIEPQVAHPWYTGQFFLSFNTQFFKKYTFFIFFFFYPYI